MRERPPDLLIGYTEFRTDLPGGRYVNQATFRAVVVKADGTGRRVLAEELTRAHNTGYVMAQSIYDWFRNPDNAALIEALRRHGLNFGHKGEAEALSNKLAGTTWVITGTLSRPRDYFEELIRRHGGRITSSVSRKTNYLLAGEEAGGRHHGADAARDEVLHHGRGGADGRGRRADPHHPRIDRPDALRFVFSPERVHVEQRARRPFVLRFALVSPLLVRHGQAAATLVRYLPSRVSIFKTSPSLMKSGTFSV